MFVLNPDPYLLPCYRISPFQTKDLHTNNQFPESDAIDLYFNERFSERNHCYTSDGRQAINLALQHYNLQQNDVVTIFTSSGNFYISSCVTKEIEKFCRWSRAIEPNTKLLFVNHEFGYPYTGMAQLKQHQLPIIEDCCHSFFSTDTDDSIGNTGDFAIYSFPKMFPLQVGGLLTSKKNFPLGEYEGLSETKRSYIKNVLSHYIVQQEEIISKRLVNYHYLLQALGKNNFEERFELVKGAVPGVFLFKIKNEHIHLPELKNNLYALGIQCSVFYGESSFFIPVHQNLVVADLDYFIEAISYQLK